MMRILYKFIFGLLYLLSLLPLRVLYIVSDFFYLLVYHVVGYRKRLVRRHLAESFPEKSETQRRAIERGSTHGSATIWSRPSSSSPSTADG